MKNNKRILTLIITNIVLLFLLLFFKNINTKINSQLKILNSKITCLESEINVLESEWSYISRPNRIYELSKKYLTNFNHFTQNRISKEKFESLFLKKEKKIERL